MGICFSLPLALNPIFPATAQYRPTPSTLDFLLLQKFESTLNVRYCWVIRAWSSDFNRSSYLQLPIGCVDQSCTAGASLGDYFLKKQGLKQTVSLPYKTGSENISVCCFSSNRLKTGDKLIITSSITRDVYIRLCISLVRYHMQIYTYANIWFIYLYFGGWKQFSLIKIDGWIDFMFRNVKFPGFEHPCKLLEYLQNKGIDSNNTLYKQQNTNGSIKEQPFLSRGSEKLYSSHQEKKQSYGSMWNAEFSRSLSSSMLLILSWNLKIIAHRDSYTISPSSKLELLC